MKIPATPPEFRQAFSKLYGQAEKKEQAGDRALLTTLFKVSTTDAKGRYLHWEELRYRDDPPPPLDIQSHWVVMRHARYIRSQLVSFLDKKRDAPFAFTPTDEIARALHEIDSQTRGGVRFPGAPPKDQEAERFLVKSLIEEPFNSSLLEGAATTRDQAVRLIRENKRPKTIGERMVLNNYRAIEFIKSQKEERLTTAIIHELHKIITEDTLEQKNKAGVFRDSSDNINVVDEINGEVLHAPPLANELPGRMQMICNFANDDGKTGAFIHPIIRAIILHFMLAYDHPYVDGNGRTARALFYWSVIKSGYWLLEYVSISRIINIAPTKYGMAFLYTETDGNDLTYFIHHQLAVLQKAINELNAFIIRKQAEVRSLNNALNSKRLKDKLNHRQLAVLHDAIRSPKTTYTIREHQTIHGVSYLTARNDLEGLADLGFLAKHKHGNKSLYRPAMGLSKKVGAGGSKS